MIVRIKNLSTGSPAFEAEVKSGSVDFDRIELVDTGATYVWQPKSGKWLDMYATPEFKGFEYEITEVAPELTDDYPALKATHCMCDDPGFDNRFICGYCGLFKKGFGPKVEPSALMDTIGNIPAEDWSKISGMANNDIGEQNNGPLAGTQPVNRAQVIRCLYAFERFARETGLIGSGGSNKPINIIFDGPPSNVSSRFVEVETDDGKGVNAGEWIKRDDGYWALRITELPPAPPATD